MKRTKYIFVTGGVVSSIGKGLAAAVYTQTTDVEIEINGLLTYDRAVLKFDPKETAAWHRALFGPPPELRAVIPTSEKTAQKWRYTTTKPDADWNKPDFDAGKWSEGEGGFGTAMTPGAVVRTTWNTSDIWLRREFNLTSKPGEVKLLMCHDEDAEVYINGVLATKTTRYIGDYQEFDISAEAAKTLRAGRNVIAVHCRQTTGGQYIDAGLVELVPAK